MARVRRKRSTNADLVEAAANCLPNILMFYKRLVVEERFPPEQGVRYPICVAGRRACPPEDCGGPRGYFDFVEAISNPDHRRHEQMLEWVGGEFDPERFDLESVNKKLQRMRTRKS